MNKPDTKELRDLAEYLDACGCRNQATLVASAADFIASLEGKHICEWPKGLHRQRLEELALFISNSFPAVKEALYDFADIAPEAPKRP